MPSKFNGAFRTNRYFLKLQRNPAFAAFLLSWIIVFLFYIPATKAGFVGDYYKDWLQIIRNERFADYINRPGTSTLYQFTQLVTYFIYKIIGASRTGWHLVHVTMHALTCAVLFSFVGRLLQDIRLPNAGTVACFVTFIFAVSPYNTEVVVHEPCLHYTLGFLMVLLPLLWLQRYFNTGSSKYLLWGWLLYLPASFSLEVFYLTPWLVLLFSLYYNSLPNSRGYIRKVELQLFLPMLLIFLGHIIAVKFFTHSALPHQVSASLSDLSEGYRQKVLKYFFNFLLLGRFWPEHLKNAIYQYCEQKTVVTMFHILIGIYILFVATRFRRINVGHRLLAVLIIVSLLFIGIVTPRAFPGAQWVVLDRYHYFAMPFLYLVLLPVLFFCCGRVVATSLFVIFAVFNVYFLVKVNNLWQQSNNLLDHLLESFPVVDNKIVLLLNTPENYNGVLMIGSNSESAFRLAYNLRHDRQITTTVYDIASFNMTSISDGAHVEVTSDSTLRVTLNQWGTWWWFHYIGASDFENDVYKLKVTDPGHWYELILKRPAKDYLLLFINKGDWKSVNLNLQNEEQQ